jgi:hypothetical protein
MQNVSSPDARPQGLERRCRGEPADPAFADCFPQGDPLVAMSLQLACGQGFGLLPAVDRDTPWRGAS